MLSEVGGIAMPRSIRGPEVHRFPEERQARMDELLDRNSSGKISAAERVELEALVGEAERLMVENTKRLSQYCRRHTGRQQQRRTPVTVWVSEATARP